MFYPAYIHKTEVGSGYSGFFPGVPGCIFAGASFEEAPADAHSALNVHFDFSADEGYEIPAGDPVENYLNHEDCQGGIWAGVTSPLILTRTELSAVLTHLARTYRNMVLVY